MNCVIPFTKEVKFKSNIAEILSISLEHDYTVNDNELLGNFTVSGEYKSHEVSVNRESFDFVLPFSVNLTNEIDPETVDFEITDFTYELKDSCTLQVNIEYSVKAKELERSEVFEEVPSDEEEQAEEVMEEVLNEPIKDEVEEERKEEKEMVEEERNVAVPTMEEEKIEEIKDDMEQEENVILKAVENKENDFVTYHIHIMKENETIESVCTKYNVSSSLLENYNDLKNITYGEKIIIPEIDE